MKHSQFIQLVTDMRTAQKNYFRNRGNKAEAKSYLERAMKLEAEVDHALNNIDPQCNFNHHIKHHEIKPIHTSPNNISHSPEGEQSSIAVASSKAQQTLFCSMRQVVRYPQDGC